jgi:hypothetical protein
VEIMAFNTKSIVKDVNAKPVPQYYNPTLDVYEVLQGANGANKVMLYTAAGAAIDLASLIATIVTAINTTGTAQLRAGTNNIGKVNVSTDERDRRGKAANKPAANAVENGTTYWSTDTDPHAEAVEVSNGTSWVVI